MESDTSSPGFHALDQSTDHSRSSGSQTSTIAESSAGTSVSRTWNGVPSLSWLSQFTPGSGRRARPRGRSGFVERQVPDHEVRDLPPPAALLELAGGFQELEADGALDGERDQLGRHRCARCSQRGAS